MPSTCWQLSCLAVVAARGDGAISIYDFSGQLGPGHSGGHDNSPASSQVQYSTVQYSTVQ